MNDAKMSVRDFCSKLEYEGIDYGFTEYGMNHTMLEEEENPEFFELVKQITEKYENLRSDLSLLRSYMDDYIEEM